MLACSQREIQLSKHPLVDNGRNENNRTITNGSICLVIMSAKCLSTRDFTVMAAKKVASALDVLTSDGLFGCDDWSDNNAFEALVADYFTGSVVDSSEDSEDDDIGIPLFSYPHILSLQ